MDEKYNYLGDLISGIREIKNESFIKRDAYGKKQINSLGEYIPNWTPPNEYVDENGFDKEYKGTHGYWDEIILPIGTIIVRYGNVIGRLTAPKGSDYDKLGLPYIKETCEYHEYEVIRSDLKIRCRVNRGVVYKMFDSAGGAIQYLHSQKISQELFDKKIKEVFSWREEMKYV